MIEALREEEKRSIDTIRSPSIVPNEINPEESD
jgi:hypothetical protein